MAATPAGTAATPAGTAATPGTTAAAAPADEQTGAADTTASTATAPGDAEPAIAGRSALSRLLESVSPYIESFGVDGLERLASPAEVSSVSAFAHGLLEQVLAAR